MTPKPRTMLRTFLRTTPALRRPPLFLVLIPVAVAMASGPLHAQDRTPDWRFETELGGTLFFGNRPQSQLATVTSINRVAMGYDAATILSYTVAVAEDSEGEVALNRRTWSAENSVDLRPDGIWRPFVTTKVGASYEKRIDLRYDGGIGIKVDHETDRNNRTEFAIAILAERTFERATSGVEGDVGTLARWYSDLRVRRTFVNDRIGIDLRNSYRPVFDAFGNFTFSSQNALSFGLNDTLAFRLNLRGDYDSRAEDRGATTNLDTQVTFSIVATF